MNTTVALSFNETTFQVVDREGMPWLIGREIALALGYLDSESINTLYSRNSDEFSNRMTCTIKLMVQGQSRETRIFSPRGCHLLAMLASTPKAKAFRAWVLDVLEGKTVPKSAGILSHAQMLKAHETRLDLLDRLNASKDPATREAIFHQFDQVTRLLGLPVMPLEAFPPPILSLDNAQAVEALWDTLKSLDADPATRLNHSHSPNELFCLHIKSLRTIAHHNGVELPEKRTLYALLKQSTNPRYLGYRTVYSAIVDDVLKCFAFRRKPTNQLIQ